MERVDDGMSPDDKQWHIECSILETDRINAEAAMVKAQAELVQAEANRAQKEAARMDAERLLLDAKEICGVREDKATLKVSCGYCNAVFEYTGTDEEAMAEMHHKFVDEHGFCRN